MYRRPHFTEYIMARLVTLAVATSFIFSILFLIFIPDDNIAFTAIGLLILGFSIFIYAINRGARRMQKELLMINKYLENLDKAEKIDYKAHFFTQEFEDINQNLIKVLNSAKKREEIKQRYTAKLKLKNRQRADMISAIAHEFRNPIASIMGYADTLLDDPNINPKIRVRFLEKILSNARKIAYMIDRLALSVKLENNDMSVHPMTFNLVDLIQDVILNLSSKYRDREIHFNGEECIVTADKDMLDNVLTNLVDNALKYSDDDVTISIIDSKLMVVDKGMGISENDIDKVSSKFYRVHKNTWDNSMGLGLAIVGYILKLHDSELIIESKVGEGSLFGFSLKKMIKTT